MTVTRVMCPSSFPSMDLLTPEIRAMFWNAFSTALHKSSYLRQWCAAAQGGLCHGNSPQNVVVCGTITTRVLTRRVAWEAQVNHGKTSSPEQQTSFMPRRRVRAKCAAGHTSLGSGIENTYSHFWVRCCDKGSIEERWASVVGYLTT